MKITYTSGIYNIYTKNSRDNPLDELHITADADIGKTISKIQKEYIRQYGILHIVKFRKAMKKCVKEQLKNII